MAFIAIVWSFIVLFVAETHSYQNTTFYWYKNEPPSSSKTVDSFILQSAYDSYNESQIKQYQQEATAHNPLLSQTLQNKTNQIHAEIQTIQQALDACIDHSRNRTQELESFLDFFSISASEPELQNLLYKTQKKLAKYVVDSNGIIKRPSSDHIKKIRKIRKEFYNKLHQYRDKTGAIITTHLINAISSGSFDNFLPCKGLSFAAQLLHNPVTANFYHVLHLARNHEFDQAANIIERYQQRAHKTPVSRSKEYLRASSIANEMNTIYNRYFYQTYNEYGIEKRFNGDPEYNAHRRLQTFPPTPNHDYNDYLTNRAQDKIFIEESVSRLYNKSTPITILADTLIERSHALEQFKREGNVRAPSIIPLSTHAKNFLQEFSVNSANLEMMHANALQKQMQHEFIAITEKTSQQYAAYRNYTKQATVVNAQLIDIGVAYTRENNIAQAHIIADCCTQILNDVEQWVESLPYPIKRALVYSQAIVCGVTDGVINSAGYMIDHPIEVALMATLPEIMVPYHVIKITCTTLRVTYDRLSRIDYKTITTDSIKAQFDDLYESVRTIDGPELVRQTVALSTQILIDGKAAHACNAASKQALSFLAKEVRHIKKARSFAPQFALAGDGRMPNVLLHASDDASMLQKIPQGSITSDIEKSIEEKFRKAVEHATTERKLEHFFDKSDHGFNDLLDIMGGAKNIEAQKKLVEKVISGLMKLDKIPCNPQGVFEGIPIGIENEIIHARGRICDGIIKLGTIFIPSRYIP